MVDTLDYFVKDGVYKLNGSTDEYIFVCLPSANSLIGKLVQFKNVKNIYENTGVSYFLNCYKEGDIKSLF